MAHISVSEHLPGIQGLMRARPDTAEALNLLAQRLLFTDKGITKGERELIAAYVSRRNNCNFCHSSHKAFAQIHLGDAAVDKVFHDAPDGYDFSDLSPLMQALLNIAGKVQGDARNVTAEDVERARAAGADDEVIHDTVLIAAAFCMFNRYVDGLGTASAPTGDAMYRAGAERVASRGYGPLDFGQK